VLAGALLLGVVPFFATETEAKVVPVGRTGAGAAAVSGAVARLRRGGSGLATVARD
jgi:hypothetical protein